MAMCELCSNPARMYCESDRAKLCWDCDDKVHSANFLVAKHSRNLLCHKCQSPTPWSASGTNLGRTVSVCVGCIDSNRHLKKDTAIAGRQPEDQRGNADVDSESEYEDEEDSSDTQDYDDGEYSVNGDDEYDDGENQVVPWSSTPSPPPVPISSSSEQSSESRFSSGSASALKRRHDDTNLDSEDDTCCSSPRFNGDAHSPEIMRFRASEHSETTCLRAFKVMRSEILPVCGEAETKMAKSGKPLREIRQGMVGGEEDNASAMISGICEMRKNL